MGLKNAILESSSKLRLVCLKQETTYVAGWIGTFHFFSALPPRPGKPKGLSIYFATALLLLQQRSLNHLTVQLVKLRWNWCWLLNQMVVATFCQLELMIFSLSRFLQKRTFLWFIEFVGRRIIRHVIKRWGVYKSTETQVERSTFSRFRGSFQSLILYSFHLPEWSSLPNFVNQHTIASNRCNFVWCANISFGNDAFQRRI